MKTLPVLLHADSRETPPFLNNEGEEPFKNKVAVLLGHRKDPHNWICGWVSAEDWDKNRSTVDGQLMFSFEEKREDKPNE